MDGKPVAADNAPARPVAGSALSPDGRLAAKRVGNVITVVDVLEPAPAGDPWPLPDVAVSGEQRGSPRRTVGQQARDGLPSGMIGIEDLAEKGPQAAHEEPADPKPALPANIEIKLIICGFDTKSAGTTILADRENPDRVVCRQVKDTDRFETTWRALLSAGCFSTCAQPTVIVKSGETTYVNVNNGDIQISATQYAAFLPPDGCPTTIEATPTLMEDGGIRLRLRLNRSDAKDSRRPAVDAAGNAQSDVVEAEVCLVLRPGQTGFIAGAMRRCKQHHEYRPLASEVPVIGECFRFHYETEIDDELVILVTPKLVSGR